jgi:hypothetical protein
MLQTNQESHVVVEQDLMVAEEAGDVATIEVEVEELVVHQLHTQMVHATKRRLRPFPRILNQTHGKQSTRQMRQTGRLRLLSQQKKRVKVQQTVGHLFNLQAIIVGDLPPLMPPLPL